METLFKVFFFTAGIIIFWSMVGYPVSIKIIGKLYKNKVLGKDYNYRPSVTVMIVAHNEEKVILNKLNNINNLNYPKDKIEFIVASDNCTDNTNQIVENFIKENPDINIRLFKVKERKGKTNAQNEAQKTVRTEFLVMTDANSIMGEDSVKELMSSFVSREIAYVAGRLSFVNKEDNEISKAESNYWDADVSIREIEAKIQTITAGNGALYACRNEDYYDFSAIQSHDSAMPLYFALQGRRAIVNNEAVVFEKSGEIASDEFKRKVRMNRVLLKQILPDIRILNFIKYKWYTYFYLGHRTCRYLLWISHLIVLVSNALLLNTTWFYNIFFIGQCIFYLLALTKLITRSNNKYLTLIYYYCMTVIAQWIGVYNIISGKAKPFWEKAETTR